MRCAVVGAGAWGTALAHLLAESGAETTLWAFEPDVVASIKRHENPRFSGQRLSSGVWATTDHAAALHGARSSSTPRRRTIRASPSWARPMCKGAILTVATKGIGREPSRERRSSSRSAWARGRGNLRQFRDQVAAHQ